MVVCLMGLERPLPGNLFQDDIGGFFLGHTVERSFQDLMHKDPFFRVIKDTFFVELPTRSITASLPEKDVVPGADQFPRNLVAC